MIFVKDIQGKCLVMSSVYSGYYLFWKLEKDLSFTYLLHMFEFTYFRNSHEKLLYKVDAFWYRIICFAKLCEEFSFSKTAVGLQLY